MKEEKMFSKEGKKQMWLKKNVPRSVSEIHEPKLDDVEKHNEKKRVDINGEFNPNMILMKRNKRHLREEDIQLKSHTSINVKSKVIFGHIF